MHLMLFVPFLLAACQTVPQAGSPRRAVPAHSSSALFEGVFDNHEQVWAARENAAAIAPPHVVVTLEPTSHTDWSIWRVHYQATPALDAVWALRRTENADGSTTLLPYRAAQATTSAPGRAFDADQWTPLEACTLRGKTSAGHLQVAADVAACAAIVPGIGADAALLPILIEREGEWLRVRLYADQARGADAREEARKVQVFGGWAAVNGAGPNAAAGKDWHMNRAVRLGNEGGRAALLWRDGKLSGYSLGLERLTYREGNVPVLKLSVVDDASGRTLGYAWANPEATRIGINLGWLQVGLERETGVP